MNDISLEFNQPKKIEQASSKNYLEIAGKTVTDRLGRLTSTIKKRVSKHVLLPASILSLALVPSDNIQNPNMNTPNIVEPTPASAPLSSFASLPTDSQVVHSGETLETQNTVDEFIERMGLKYGIKVKVDLAFYDNVSDYMRDNYIIGPKPKDPLTKEEISVLEEAIGTIPFCSKITDRLYIFKIPMRKESDDDVLSGSVESKGKDSQSSSHIQLMLSENIDLSSSPGEYTKLGLETYKERIQQLFFHECGHRVSDKILRAAYPGDEYFDITDNSRPVVKDYLKEQKHPLYRAFAKLEGWDLKREIFEQEIPQEHVYFSKDPDMRMVYDRTSFYIEEHFAELFSLYFANPSILTPQEKMFFQKIDEGFSSNVEEFAKQIAQDPTMLLRNQ